MTIAMLMVMSVAPAATLQKRKHNHNTNDPNHRTVQQPMIRLYEKQQPEWVNMVNRCPRM